MSAGVKGGLAGGAAMAFLAVSYGWIFHRSIWYPINLLAAGFLPASATTLEKLLAFNWEMFLIATFLHLTTCLLVGLLYGALLPMMPRHPIFLGGGVEGEVGIINVSGKAGFYITVGADDVVEDAGLREAVELNTSLGKEIEGLGQVGGEHTVAEVGMRMGINSGVDVGPGVE